MSQGHLLSHGLAAPAALPDTVPRDAAGRPARRRWLRAVLSVLLGAALLGVAVAGVPALRHPILRGVGSVLVVQDVLGPADVIVVAVGTDGAGVLEAADLVHAGVAARVAVFADPPDPVVDREFLNRGVPYENAAQRSVRQLRALGIEGVEEVPRAVAGSDEESRVLPEWCRQRGFRSVVVVTTTDHSRRVRRLLRRSMQGQPTHVAVRPARFSTFDPGRWWETRDDARTGIIELQKLFLDVLLHPLS